MPRLFIALELPDSVKRQLLALSRSMRGARWQNEGQLHLTLKFIGEIDGSRMQDLLDALSEVKVEPFTLQIEGVDYIGSRRYPRILYAKVNKPSELSRLYRRINSALEGMGLELEKQKLRPHITLARLKETPYPEIARFLQTESLLKSEAFPIDSFHLFRSKLSPSGSEYQIEASFRFTEET